MPMYSPEGEGDHALPQQFDFDSMLQGDIVDDTEAWAAISDLDQCV